MGFPPTLAHAIRFLSIDAVNKAQSGHPGMPLGMADIAAVLWYKFLKHNPNNPAWFNRDRFVLSNGHGSMLLYSLLHLTGYKLTIEDIKQFRQLHSKTPGHPEVNETPGVESTTGPLGQGLANAVGMALAEQLLAKQFNQDTACLVDHYTYAFVGDGCLMEGISHEVCSLAGTLGLGKLIVFYDDNGISIDGQMDTWFTDDTAARFRAYHWQVIGPIDGHDAKSIEQAIISARADTSRPSLIICRTIIGYGSSVAGTAKAHGAPLSQDDIQRVRSELEWPYAPFEIPEAIYATWNHQEQGNDDESQWLMRCFDYQAKYPTQYADFLRRINGDLPDNWDMHWLELFADCRNATTPIATRKASQFCLQQIGPWLPELLGGSADLSESNSTHWTGCRSITHDDFSGNYLSYGVREFGMSAIMNGVALHGGFIPYGGTFLVFSDYARSALRMSALMKQRVIYVYSHDSIGLGEDGPTHQPVEHLAMLRLTPNVKVWRPASLLETAVAWQQALETHDGLSCLVLSRQVLARLDDSHVNQHQIQRGGYILDEDATRIDVILIATGSEVSLALNAAQALRLHGLSIRVVSMPCVEVFLEQDKAYQHSVLPLSIRKRVAIEAAASGYWYRFVGLDGVVIGLDKFGVSAEAAQAYNYFNITVEAIVASVLKLAAQHLEIYL